MNYILLTEDDREHYLFVLGVLNSAITNLVFKCFSTNSNVNGYEVDNLPIPHADAKSQADIARLAKQCLDAGGIGCEAFEKEIDERVAALYGL